ncbi:LysR family transcriptional regulator [Williamwhitmania taraxaci]|uniref:DNA-binding transcriptional regulator, LysR family n=1 Tax=Williamwhitmania taraxaci TaxID=1640674 RepID=A0A1G6MH81_9BACT|nr:LysR family transcriptional regulator [Williamwhitmania taraxaci]SDC54872.1 DNA-binding transcriptional regulator, LysR family [Williamwhitmania taraxaci]
MLDFRLKVFQCVAHNLSFTKASNEMFVTQPAISKHIKELESEFEVKLFNRSGNKISLTSAGDILLSYTEHILSLHNEMKFEISQLTTNLAGSIRIGASTTIAQYVIPAALAQFHERYPDIKLSLITGNTEYIEKRLLKNEIDVGIVEGKPTNSDIRYSSFLNDELLVFASALNANVPNSISNDEFVNLPLVLRERGSGTLEIIESTLQQHKVSPKQLRVLMYLGSTEAIKSFVKTGKGVGIVSRFAIEQELASNVFMRIATPNIKFYRQFYFISPKGPESIGLSKLFLNFIQKHYNL